MSDARTNHYDYLDLYGPQFSAELDIDNIAHMSSAHGDKAYGYGFDWERKGLPFSKGVMIFLLSYLYPYSKTVRTTENGWVDTGDWVLDRYNNDSVIRAALDRLPSYYSRT